MTKEEMDRVLEEAKAAETDNALPTGRCRIDCGFGVKTCVSGMTERSCAKVATDKGCSYDWTEGASCP